MAIPVQKHLFKVGGSFAVTLPRDWVAYHGLGEGAIIEVVANNELTIRPVDTHENQEV